MKKIFYIISFIVLSGFIFSCTEDNLDPTLAQNKDINNKESVNSVSDLQGLLNGVLNRMTSTYYYGRDFIIFGEVRTDNCYANNKSGRFETAAEMKMGDTDAYAEDAWTQMYKAIAAANFLIQFENNTSLEGDSKEQAQIIGQAYALRALVHFDLLTLFGQQHVTSGGNKGIPYVTKYKGNMAPARNTVTEVKTAIYADLTKALSLMNVTLNSKNPEYITTYGVKGIRARVALYFEDWAQVLADCNDILNITTPVTSTTDAATFRYPVIAASDYLYSWSLDAVANSVFELAFSPVDNANINGLQYIYRGSSYGDIRVLADLKNIFTTTDIRRNIIGMEGKYITNLGKYPSADYSDNISIIRSEEIVLNRAEALWRINPSDPEALLTLNLIPAKRNANPYSAINLDTILLERRKELCFEGFRFNDLARTGKNIPEVDPLKQTHKGPVYGSYNYAFPIPKVELNANSKMEQNKGY